MDTGCGFRFDNFRKQCSGELELYIDYVYTYGIGWVAIAKSVLETSSTAYIRTYVVQY